MGGGSKALWVACVVFVPFLGTFIYLLSRPSIDAAMDTYAADMEQHTRPLT
jgi:hypothetical protein